MHPGRFLAALPALSRAAIERCTDEMGDDAEQRGKPACPTWITSSGTTRRCFGITGDTRPNDWVLGLWAQGS
jgi:hypothetical protein